MLRSFGRFGPFGRFERSVDRYWRRREAGHLIEASLQVSDISVRSRVSKAFSIHVSEKDAVHTSSSVDSDEPPPSPASWACLWR